MKKSLVLVVVLLCVAGLMAAMAYTNAYVANDASMTIVDTTDGSLELGTVGGKGNEDLTARIDENGNLVFNFAKGNLGKDFGFQRNSIYGWERLFYVKNNSSEPVWYTIENEGLTNIWIGPEWWLGNAKNHDFWFITDGIINPNAGTRGVEGYAVVNGQLWRKLAPDQKHRITVKFFIEDDENVTLNGRIIVKAAAGNTIGDRSYLMTDK
ncbi:MAG TPA: hypothetical protein GXZ32_00980 [Clostridiales bacterium]|nr:hypothetical protein [Clostridiales bacterium]